MNTGLHAGRVARAQEKRPNFLSLFVSINSSFRKKLERNIFTLVEAWFWTKITTKACIAAAL